MATVRLIIASCIFISCSDTSEFIIQPELRNYYHEFVSEGLKRGITIDNSNLIMQIKPGILKQYGGLGVTLITRNQTYIYIDQDYYNKRGELIEMTVFHELGHAKLNRDHTNTWSLMNPNIAGADDWPTCADGEQCKQGLISELFNKWTW